MKKSVFRACWMFLSVKKIFLLVGCTVKIIDYQVSLPIIVTLTNENNSKVSYIYTIRENGKDKFEKQVVHFTNNNRIFLVNKKSWKIIR